MAKPNWTPTDPDVFLTDAPNKDFEVNESNEAFLAYHCWSDTQKWYAGWKTYSTAWACIRYGTNLSRNKHAIYIVKNLKTNEIVWRSWKDENKYRLDY